MQLNSDQKIQKILDQNQYSQPNFLCGSKKKITHICIDRDCKAPSLHCQHWRCTFCESRQQNSFSSLQLRPFSTLMKKKSQKLKHFDQQLIKIEGNMLKSLSSRKIQLIQQARYGNLTQQETHILQSLFGGQHKYRKFKGHQMSGLVQKLKKNNQTLRVDDQLRIFQRQIGQIEDKIFKCQQTAINEITKPTKHYAKVDSKIMEQDPVGIGYILEQLDYPSELKLLFRAIQVGFSNQQFHKKCDRIPNTLTIIKTEHNKILAGFTPLTWQNLEPACFKNDEQLGTFVLSVNLKQKYQLMEPQRAIVCSKKLGPDFGNFDFSITSLQSRQNAYISMKFPQNLNLDLDGDEIYVK